MDAYLTEVSTAGETLLKRTDVTGQGVVSLYDRAQSLMVVNFDYYDVTAGAKLYKCREEIKDEMSLFHWDLYQRFQTINSLAVFRSMHTMLWAQSHQRIPPTSIYHIEHFYGEIPCTQSLKVPTDMDFSTYAADSVRDALGGKTPKEIPGVVLSDFGAVVFADTPEFAVRTAEKLELVAHMTWELRRQAAQPQYIDYAVMNKFHVQANKSATSYLTELEE